MNYTPTYKISKRSGIAQLSCWRCSKVWLKCITGQSVSI